MRAPPDSFRPTTVRRSASRESMTWQIFFALASLIGAAEDGEVLGEDVHRAASTAPQPATTPSPTIFRSAMPGSSLRCVTKTPSSWNGAGIEQELQALAGGEAALRVQLRDALLAAAFQGPAPCARRARRCGSFDPSFLRERDRRRLGRWLRDSSRNAREV
jgi:hypothetical protein